MTKKKKIPHHRPTIETEVDLRALVLLKIVEIEVVLVVKVVEVLRAATEVHQDHLILLEKFNC
jgi:hypothetical protein